MASTLRNPNPARITPELWAFWLAFRKLEPSALLGGFYARKAGYHNTRAALPRSDYSVRSAADCRGPKDKCSAIDITFPSAQRGNFRTIAKYSARLLRSGRNHGDERGNYLREFYGNADDDREVEGWDFQRVGPATSDSSHLWHIHISFTRGYVDNAKAMRAVLSILAGESVKVWRAKEAKRLLPPPKPRPKAPASKPPAVKVPRPVPRPVSPVVVLTPPKPPLEVVDLLPDEPVVAVVVVDLPDEPAEGGDVPASPVVRLVGLALFRSRLRTWLNGPFRGKDNA